MKPGRPPLRTGRRKTKATPAWILNTVVNEAEGIVWRRGGISKTVARGRARCVASFEVGVQLSVRALQVVACPMEALHVVVARRGVR